MLKTKMTGKKLDVPANNTSKNLHVLKAFIEIIHEQLLTLISTSKNTS